MGEGLAVLALILQIAVSIESRVHGRRTARGGAKRNTAAKN
jgi:hypothetical protein